jgi:chromosome segregation ATPase
MDKQNIWNHYETLEKKMAMFEQKDSVNFSEIGNIHSDLRNLQMDLVKIQNKPENLKEQLVDMFFSTEKRLQILEFRVEGYDIDVVSLKNIHLNLQNDFKKLEIEFAKIQTKIEERNIKQPDLPQISFKKGPGRPPNILQE